MEFQYMVFGSDTGNGERCNKDQSEQLAINCLFSYSIILFTGCFLHFRVYPNPDKLDKNLHEIIFYLKIAENYF